MTFNRQPKKSMKPEAALIRLEELCARSEQCSAELMQKLRRWGLPASEADKILTTLVDRRFVDDARFARAFVRDKYRFARWGRRRIALELRKKRISSDTITEALEQIDDEQYHQILIHIITRRIAACPDICDYNERLKIFRHAVSRGYEPALVNRILNAEVRKLRQ